MEISVNLGASEENGWHVFDLEDLGVTKLEWDLLSQDEKKTVVENAVFELPSQPYWMVDSFKEK